MIINTTKFVDSLSFQLFQLIDRLVYILNVEITNKNSINSTLIILQLFLFYISDQQTVLQQ